MTAPTDQEERIKREFTELVGFDSVSLNERRCADWLTARLIELGFTVEEDDAGAALGGNAGNLHAWLPATDEAAGEPILLSAHMDVVEPGRGKRAIFADGTFTSDGSTVLGADDVAGIIEILEGVRSVLTEGRPHRGIELIFCVDEETYARGSRLLDHRRIRSREAYVLDLSGAPGTAAVAAPSLISFRAEVIGRASHAGFSPERGINAIAIAARALADLEQGRLSDGTTRNVGTVAGGTGVNIVPERCVCTGEVRSSDHGRALEAVEEARRAFERAVRDSGATLEFSSKTHIRAYRTPEDSPAVTRFRDACRRCGLAGDLVETFGGSDNNNFAEMGIAGIVLSCGMMGAHTCSEHVSLEDLVVGARLVEHLI